LAQKDEPQKEISSESHVTLIKSKFHVFIPLILQRRPHKHSGERFWLFSQRFLSAILAFCLGQAMHNENLIYGDILYTRIYVNYSTIFWQTRGSLTHFQWVRSLIPIFMSPATINLSAFC